MKNGCSAADIRAQVHKIMYIFQENKVFTLFSSSGIVGNNLINRLGHDEDTRLDERFTEKGDKAESSPMQHPVLLPLSRAWKLAPFYAMLQHIQ